LKYLKQQLPVKQVKTYQRVSLGCQKLRHFTMQLLTPGDPSVDRLLCAEKTLSSLFSQGLLCNELALVRYYPSMIAMW
jgi:hypothetical protein